MKKNKFPDWAPADLIEEYRKDRATDEASKLYYKLLTNPDMEQVWRQLNRRKKALVGDAEGKAEVSTLLLLCLYRCRWEVDVQFSREDRIRRIENIRDSGKKFKRAIQSFDWDGFYPVSTDGYKKVDNSKSFFATRRRIRGL
jgi:hypothetical protein